MGITIHTFVAELSSNKQRVHISKSPSYILLTLISRHFCHRPNERRFEAIGDVTICDGDDADAGFSPLFTQAFTRTMTATNNTGVTVAGHRSDEITTIIFDVDDTLYDVGTVS